MQPTYSIYYIAYVYHTTIQHLIFDSKLRAFFLGFPTLLSCALFAFAREGCVLFDQGFISHCGCLYLKYFYIAIY